MGEAAVAKRLESAMAESAVATQAAMLKVAQSIRQRGSRKVWNAWAAMALEAASAKRKAAGALRTFSPEGRKTRAAWKPWAAQASARAP